MITDRSYSTSSCAAISILHVLSFISLEKLPRNLSARFRSSTRPYPEHQIQLKGGQGMKSVSWPHFCLEMVNALIQKSHYDSWHLSVSGENTDQASHLLEVIQEKSCWGTAQEQHRRRCSLPAPSPGAEIPPAQNPSSLFPSFPLVQPRVLFRHPKQG